MKKLTLFLLLCLGGLASCGNMFEDEPFKQIQTPYVGNELRVDGYYYNLHSDSSCGTFLLYRNGVILSTGYDESLEECEEGYANGSTYLHLKDFRFAWSLFRISKDTLIEEFRSAFGGFHLYSVTDWYKIINDSTIYLFKSFFTYDSKSSYEYSKDTFHFKAFSPKPDSINRWFP